MDEIERLKAELNTAKQLLEQEKGKRLAVERKAYETERAAKIATDQAEALKAETEAAMVQASQHMQIAHAVSCGIYGLARMSQSYMARKVAAGRVVHREQQNLLLMQQMIDAIAKGDRQLLQIATDKAQAIIATVKSDGERARVEAAQASIGYGFKKFAEIFDQLVTENNPAV